MFLGQYVSNIEEDGWVSLPLSFSTNLAEGLVVTRGLDHNLLVFGSETWDALAGRLAAQALTNADVRGLRRRLFAMAAQLQVNANDRIQLPALLRDFAEVSDSAVMAGMFDHFEIWNPQAWMAAQVSAVAGGQDDRWQALGI